MVGIILQKKIIEILSDEMVSISTKVLYFINNSFEVHLCLSGLSSGGLPR